jgi:hypothetical protein
LECRPTLGDGVFEASRVKEAPDSASQLLRGYVKNIKAEGECNTIYFDDMYAASE